MLALTLIYALMTILGVGSILNPILHKCEVTRKPSSAEDHPQSSGEDERQGSDDQEARKRCCHCCRDFKSLISHLNEHRFSPVFIKHHSENGTDHKISRHLELSTAQVRDGVGARETGEGLKVGNDGDLDTGADTSQRTNELHHSRLPLAAGDALRTAK